MNLERPNRKAHGTLLEPFLHFMSPKLAVTSLLPELPVPVPVSEKQLCCWRHIVIIEAKVKAMFVCLHAQGWPYQQALVQPTKTKGGPSLEHSPRAFRHLLHKVRSGYARKRVTYTAVAHTANRETTVGPNMFGHLKQGGHQSLLQYASFHVLYNPTLLTLYFRSVHTESARQHCNRPPFLALPHRSNWPCHLGVDNLGLI